MNHEYENKIKELDEEILHYPDRYELYYMRGMYHFLEQDFEKAQADYIKSVSLGLDCTKYPYYPYSVNPDAQETKQYSLRDKIILSLFLVLFAILLAWDSLSLIVEIKHRFFG